MATTLTRVPSATVSALKVSTKVLPGNRIELADPALSEGDAVEVIVLIPSAPATVPFPRPPGEPGVWDFIQSLKPVERTPQEWAALEAELQEDRDSWDS